MGALSEQLIKNNLAMPKMDSPLFMALLRFKKEGGGYDRARAILDRAYDRGKTNDDAEAYQGMRESARLPLPSASSPQANGSGPAQHAHPRLVIPVTPVRRPPLDFTSDFIRTAKNTIAQSVFDRIRTSDGRAWGDVGAHELDSMARDGTMANAIRVRIGVLSNSQRFMKVRELISPETFEQIRSETHGS